MSGLSQLQKAILRAAIDNRPSLEPSQRVDLKLSDALCLANTTNRRAAQASICRAFGRLESRGLVERYVGSCARWSGIKVTPRGESLVNKMEKIPAR